MRLSLTRIIIAGVILAGLPFVAIAQHWHITSKDTRFELRTQLSGIHEDGNIDMVSEITTLDLNELTGTNNIQRWDTVYIHMASGPNLIAYPFSISKERPRGHQGQNVFSIRAFVTERKDDLITLKYSFDRFLPSQDLKAFLQDSPQTQARIEVAVNGHSVPRLLAVDLDGKRYPYRVIEKPVLKGLTQ